MNFIEFGLNDSLLEAINYMGFEKATPIQIQAIPKILEGEDLIACAQTGTGKTAAFLLPILEKISGNPNRSGVNTVILVPTRELAIQIEQQIRGTAYFIGVSSMAIYGGGDGSTWDQEKKTLTEGSDIIVVTPGKLISHLKLGYVKLENVKHLVLDEADRMLDIGFYDDLMKIVSYLPEERQTLMFSATMDPRIRKLAKVILKNPSEVSTAISKPADGVLQVAYLTYNPQKIQLINKLIVDKPEYTSILIFSSTKKSVYELVKALRQHKIDAEAISSDLEQTDREKVLEGFRARKTRILVATDVLSRGIDIKDIHLIINFDVPQDAEDYVHRVGRTARADNTGVAITLVNEDDMGKFHQIEELIESSILKLPVPEELGASPEYKVIPRRKYKNYRKGKKNYSKGNSNQRNSQSRNRNRKA